MCRRRSARGDGGGSFSAEEKRSIMESLNKAASAPQGASQSLMRPESRESERPLFRASETLPENRTMRRETERTKRRGGKAEQR